VNAQQGDAIRKVIGANAVLDDKAFAGLKRAVGKEIEVDFTQTFLAGPQSGVFHHTFTVTLLDFFLVVDDPTGETYLAFLRVRERHYHPMLWFPHSSDTGPVTSSYVTESTNYNRLDRIRDKKTHKTVCTFYTTGSIARSEEGAVQGVSVSFKNLGKIQHRKGAGLPSILMRLFQRRSDR
jgi:hypothetical protein